MCLQLEQEAIVDFPIPSQSSQRNVTDVLPFAALMYVQTAETKLAFVFLSLCKIFTSRQKMFLTAQQQTGPIINYAHSTASPGKNTCQCHKIKSPSRCLVGSDIRLSANIVETNDILFCITADKSQ